MYLLQVVAMMVEVKKKQLQHQAQQLRQQQVGGTEAKENKKSR